MTRWHVEQRICIKVNKEKILIELGFSEQIVKLKLKETLVLVRICVCFAQIVVPHQLVGDCVCRNAGVFIVVADVASDVLSDESR